MLTRVLEPEVMDDPQETAAYDAMDHSQPNRAFVDRLVSLGARGRMLDIGTGPGHIPILVCQRIPNARVFAVDLSPHMLEIARGKLAATLFAGRIEFHLGDAKDLGFEDHAFDAVFSNTILHHIPDPAAFLAEAWRVLRPGGSFLIRDLFRPPDEATLESLVALHAADADAQQRKLFADSLRAALTPDELRAMVKSLGMSGVEVVVDTDRHVSVQRAARAPA